MGKEIIIEKSPEIPGKRSRLWLCEDVVKVLEDNQGTDAMEIIYVEFPSFKDVEVQWDGTAFKDMNNLKTLIIKNGRFPKSPKHLPNSLRVLKWWRYPSECFPYDFRQEKLSILKLLNNLYMSSQLDSVSKKLVTLKVLNFDYSDSLKEKPDMSNLPSLQNFPLKDLLHGFTVLPECIQQFRFLIDLKVDDCKHLLEIRGISPNLEHFSAVNCKSLSLGCTSMLLNQELYENGNIRFTLPGRRIPSWFEKCSRGASISFWFRGKFPSKALCIAILLMDKQPSPVRVTPILWPVGVQNGSIIYFLSAEDKYEVVPAESIAKAIRVHVLK
ncbi:hypothetical protein PIB30_063499 [Stylosanthes scabra]|uniref:Uncharacterized protein n=1 Tax=Stylosanthes scabra TaxID=79078 RepID=A0ABU6QKX7_9FABA|nr:hypothetical protein [Stylosanthes scabra]